MILKNSVFLRFMLVLDGLESSGSPVGRISTKFREICSGGFRPMTKSPPKLTSIKLTSIKFWAYIYFIPMYSYLFVLICYKAGKQNRTHPLMHHSVNQVKWPKKLSLGRISTCRIRLWGQQLQNCSSRDQKMGKTNPDDFRFYFVTWALEKYRKA